MFFEMFGIEVPPWAIALQIIAVLWFLLGAYVFVFWTPVNFLLRLTVHDWWHDRRWKKQASQDQQLGFELTYWQRYRHWNNLSLAWFCGIELSRRRSEGRTFAAVHGLIYQAVSMSQLPEIIGQSAAKFSGWDNDHVEAVANYMAREFLHDQTAAVTVLDFLRDEQRHIRRFPEEFAQHAERLFERFGLQPFEVQTWLAEELAGEA